MKPRNREVLDLLLAMDTLTPMDAMRACGISGGGFTKAISDLRNKHGVRIRKVTKTDPLTLTRYPAYSLDTKMPGAFARFTVVPGCLATA